MSSVLRLRAQRRNRNEDRSSRCAGSAWAGLCGVRGQWIAPISSDASSPGRGGGPVHNGVDAITPFRGAGCCAVHRWIAIVGESIRSTGADDSGPGDREHSLLSHFHGAYRLATGFRGGSSLVRAVLLVPPIVRGNL